MQTINIKSSFSTEILPELSSVQTIEIADSIMGNGEGAFGKVYECISVNNSACSVNQVIKILTPNKDIHIRGYETIQKLQAKLKSKNQELISNGKGSILDVYSALKAIPQISFKGTLNNEEVYGYAANNLNNLGFVCLKDVLEKMVLIKEPFENKIQMVYHLVNAFEFLESIFFIHADLKDDAIYINTSTKECSIIDFDSGAVADGNNDQPTTIGSLQEWLAPEIVDQFGKSSHKLNEVMINLNSDRWSITMAIFFLLFSYSPFFMLVNLAPETLKKYFSEYKWPEIGIGEPYFRKEYEQLYNQFISWYNQSFSPAIKKIFETTFKQGYFDPGMRNSYRSWKYALQNSQNTPSIKTFSSNIKTRNNLTPVMLQWNVDYEEEIILHPGNINVTGANSYTVDPSVDTSYTLIAKNYCGQDVKKIEVKVSKLPPVIRMFQSNTLIRTGIEAVKLWWEVDNYIKLRLDPGSIDVTGKKSIEVKPMTDSNYILTAESFSGIKSKKTLLIKISKNPPDIKELKSDKPIRLNRTPVNLFWETEYAYNLLLKPGNIDVTGKSTIAVEPLRNTKYILEAKSYFGVKSEKSIEIQVSKEPPIIEKFVYEVIDNFNNVYLLKWQVKNAEYINIVPFQGEILNKQNLEIQITNQNEFTLTATSIFGYGASKTINITTLFNNGPMENIFNKIVDNVFFNLKLNSNFN